MPCRREATFAAVLVTVVAALWATAVNRDDDDGQARVTVTQMYVDAPAPTLDDRLALLTRP